MARRFGSAMISKTDSTLLIYSARHMRVKVYTSGEQEKISARVRGCTAHAFSDGVQFEALRSPVASNPELQT